MIINRTTKLNNKGTKEQNSFENEAFVPGRLVSLLLKF
jgi:hypothetical protein